MFTQGDTVASRASLLEMLTCVGALAGLQRSGRCPRGTELVRGLEQSVTQVSPLRERRSGLAAQS